jgi:hypothetical protein
VGLRRSGMPREHITELRRAFRDAFRPVIRKDEMIRMLEDRGRECPPVLELAKFVAEAKRPICAGHGKVPRELTAWLHGLRRGKSSFDGTGDGPSDEE